MRSRCDNQLTVLGALRAGQLFRNSQWGITLRARYLEPLEFSPRRFVCRFETTGHDLTRLQTLSRQWPRLVLLLDFEIPTQRIKGIAKAKAGELEQCIISY